MRLLFRALFLLFPWFLRRRLLIFCYGYHLHPTARIGLAWVYPKKLVMGPHSQIGHLTVCVNLDEVRLEEYALIGRGNWITGFPSGHPRHFAHQSDRRPSLQVRRHAAITHRHIIDCTAEVVIGEFATLAGYRSQIITHSIDVVAGRQSSAPVQIGAYSFVGTGCIILGGAVLPRASMLGAASLLNKAYEASYTLYGGTPARPLKTLPADSKYFQRSEGYVD